MSLIKCKVPPGKGSWLNRFLSDIMNLQSPPVLLRMFWEKISSATEGEVHWEGESLHFLCLGAWETFPTQPGGWEEIIVKHWEGGEGAGTWPSIYPSLLHSTPLSSHWRVGVTASLLSLAAQLCHLSSSKTLQVKHCSQRGIASRHRKEGWGFFQHSDPVFSVTQLCRIHKEDTGCALLALRLMFGNNKTDGFICLIIWCCQERP